MIVSKLAERVENPNTITSGTVSKLQDRQSPVIPAGPTMDIVQARQTQTQPLLQSAYKQYATSFEQYQKEREDYSKALEEWKTKAEREKEFLEYQQSTAALTQNLANLQTVYQKTFKTPNKQLQSFSKDITGESQALRSAETENEQRIEKLDTETSATLAPFKYYEGLGFATGEIGHVPYNITGGSGLADYYYGSGTYSVYDPATGKIVEYQARPLSSNLGVKINIAGKEYTPEELDELNPQKINLIDQYINNTNYDIVRDSSGNISKIISKDKSEEVLVNNNMINQIVKKSTYRPYPNVVESYDAETITYDPNGLISSYVRRKDIPTYKGSDRERVVEADIKQYQYGIPVVETNRYYYDGGVSRENVKNYLEGKEYIYTEDDQKVLDIGKIKPLSQEAISNIQQFGSGYNFTRDYLLAEPGEPQYMKPVSYTQTTYEYKGDTKVPVTNIYTVTAPAFASPLVKGEKVALFGSQEKAEQVLKGLPFQELGYRAPLQQYKEQVFLNQQKQRNEYWRNMPAAVIPSKMGNTWVISRKSASEAQRLAESLGSPFSMYTPKSW